MFMFVVKIMHWHSITAFQMSAIVNYSHKNTNHHKEQLSFLVHSPSEKKTEPLISQVCSMRPLRFYLREIHSPLQKRKKKLIPTTKVYNFLL